MFILSVRASSVRFFAVLALMVVLLAVVVTSVGTEAVFASASSGYSFEGVRDEDDRRTFLAQFGIEVTGGPTEEVTFSVPRDFDLVLRGYNEVQKAQGLDLSRYAGKRVTRYTYEVSNSADEGQVLVTMLVHRGRVIGADVSSADPTGFVRPLTEFMPKAAS